MCNFRLLMQLGKKRGWRGVTNFWYSRLQYRLALDRAHCDLAPWEWGHPRKSALKLLHLESCNPVWLPQRQHALVAIYQ